jgi:hypothetical protein
VCPLVALVAEGDEVFFRVISCVAAKVEVVNFELRPPTTMLTGPSVALQHLFAELVVGFRIKPNSRLFGEGGQSVPPETCAGATAT